MQLALDVHGHGNPAVVVRCVALLGWPWQVAASEFGRWPHFGSLAGRAVLLQEAEHDRRSRLHFNRLRAFLRCCDSFFVVARREQRRREGPSCLHGYFAERWVGI